MNMPCPSAHLDSFVSEHLPSSQHMPSLVYDAHEFAVPPQANAVVSLLDPHRASTAPLLRDARQTLSYAQVFERVNQTAQALAAWGLVSGNRVLLRGGNSIDMAIAWLACVKMGCVVVATMPMLRAKELTEIATKAQVRHALCADALFEELALTQQVVPMLSNALKFGELAQRARVQPTHFEACPTSADDVAMLAFTSGTTGQPKAAAHTHRDLLNACNAWPKHVLRQTASDIVVGSPPLAFTFGCGGMLLFPMWAGASVYFHDGPYTPELMVRTIKQVGATVCYSAPTFYRQMAPFAQALGVPSLRESVSAGEGLPDATRSLWRDATGLEMLDGIGATELFHIFISSAGADVRAGAVGKVVPGYEAKVVGEDGVELPRGQVGVLAVRGVTGCKYLDDPRQTRYVQNGWNHPGDSFMQDADGYFFYQARADDMIVTAGYNVGGPEVEDAVLKHPAVAECGVVGVPDSERGMRIKAYVVLKAGQVADAAQIRSIQDHVKATIAPYKYPREIEFRPNLPRTETGKLQRFKLRQWATHATQTPGAAA